MREYEDYGYKIQEFDSLSEVASYLEEIPNLKDYVLTQSKHLKSNPKFYGITNFDDVFDRLRYGDKVQTENFINNLKDLESYDDLDVGIFRDIEGFAYDMGSVVNGEPECCLNFGSPEAKPSLKMYIDIAYCWRASVEDINNRGLAIVKLINTLIAKGYILDVYLLHHVEVHEWCEPEEYFAQQIKIDTNFLTLANIAYAGTCDFFRVVCLLLTAILKKDKKYHGDDSKSNASDDFVKNIKARGDLYIPSGYGDDELYDCSKEKAEELVIGYYEDYVKSKGGELCLTN